MEKVFNICDIEADAKLRKLRYCKAILRAVKLFDGTVLVDFVSYDKRIMWVEYSPKTFTIVKADFYPYRSIATYSHVRKFCSLFRNGEEVYREYKRAVKCNYHITYVK